MARKFIAEAMGARYAESVILNMETMHAESTKRTPMICFLSMGSDPTENIMLLAKKLGYSCSAISMGQGQEVHARRLLSVSMAEGKWVLLQNCHLGLDFMDELLETVSIFFFLALIQPYSCPCLKYFKTKELVLQSICWKLFTFTFIILRIHGPSGSVDKFFLVLH